MVSDLDIYRSANLLVKQHGEDAPIEAAMRADAGKSAPWFVFGGGFSGRWTCCRGRVWGRKRCFTNGHPLGRGVAAHAMLRAIWRARLDLAVALAGFVGARLAFDVLAKSKLHPDAPSGRL